VILIVISAMVILCCYSRLRQRRWPVLSIVVLPAAINEAHYPLQTPGVKRAL